MFPLKSLPHYSCRDVSRVMKREVSISPERHEGKTHDSLTNQRQHHLIVVNTSASSSDLVRLPLPCRPLLCRFEGIFLTSARLTESLNSAVWFFSGGTVRSSCFELSESPADFLWTLPRSAQCTMHDGTLRSSLSDTVFHFCYAWMPKDFLSVWLTDIFHSVLLKQI